VLAGPGSYRDHGIAPLISPCSARRASPRPRETDTASVAVMKWWLRTPSGRALYAERKSTVETVFGVIKEVLGFRRFICVGCRQCGENGIWCARRGI